MDLIHVTGIREYGYTGFLPEERVLGQWFEVDLTLWLDLAPAGSSDDIQDTIDYRQAITIVQHLIKTAKFVLLEKLARVIAEALLKLEKIQQVRVQLAKPTPPIPDFGGTVQVDITVNKSEAK